MAFASASFRPYSESAQVFKSMAHSNTQRGLNTSTKGEFIFTQRAGLIRKVKTIEETRREKLQMLVKQHGGTANLCEKLGYSRAETSKLTRIANGNVRHDRGGKPYELGSATARFIEDTLLLERGWMDNMSIYEDPDIDQRMRHLHKVAEELEPYQVDQLIKIGLTLAEPAKKNGTAN